MDTTREAAKMETTTCPICAERSDLRRTAPKGEHGLLAHSQFGQLAWELGITRSDNPEEWAELKSVTR